MTFLTQDCFAFSQRVPPGAKKGNYRYLKTSHIETAKSTERPDIYYTFHEVLYALCERRAGRSMPRNSEELDTLRTKLSLMMPTLRLETIDEVRTRI